MFNENEIVERLNKIFVESLGCEVSEINDDLEYEFVCEWTSRAHMLLITKIESEFDITLSPYDILEMSSYNKAKNIIFTALDERND